MQRHTGKGSSSRSSCGDVLRGTQQAGMSVLRLLSVPLHPCASAVDLFTFHFSLFTFRFSLFTFRFSLFTFHFSLFAFASPFVFDPLPSARSSTKDPAGRNACITIFLLYLPAALEYVPRAHHT